MNHKMVIYILGLMMRIAACLMLVPMTLSIFFSEEVAAFSFLPSVLFLLSLSSTLTGQMPDKKSIYAREGMVIVALSWLIFSFFGAIPFYISGSIPSFVDSFFETVSGFTTTGSTILTDIEVLPRGLLFWRSFTHWIGGMGVLVFALAVLPKTNARAMHIMKAEVPGPTVGKLASRVKSTARILYGIYIALTVLQIIFLLIGDMPLFDSVVTALSTAGTGGFAIKNHSIGYYNSYYLDMVISVFMLIFAINFNLFYLLLTKNVVEALRSEELHWFLGIVAIATLFITLDIKNLYPTYSEAFRYGFFQVSSIISSTGFSTYDYMKWSPFVQAILMLLMIVGACAGSTGGGVKVSRIVIMFKSVARSVRRMIHPNWVMPVTLDGKSVEDEMVNSIGIYIMTFLLVSMASVLALAALGLDLDTAFGAVNGTINNIGPGLNSVGPVGNFAHLSVPAKLILCFDMLAGRLEFFPVFAIFSLSTWKK